MHPVVAQKKFSFAYCEQVVGRWSEWRILWYYCSSLENFCWFRIKFRKDPYSNEVGGSLKELNSFSNLWRIF
jgi:hypothetical protein